MVLGRLRQSLELGRKDYGGRDFASKLRVRDDVSVIGAFIVPHAGAHPTKEEIEGFAAERLAPYKRPRAVVLLEALPRTANSKVMRSQLKLPGNFSTS